MWRVKGIAQQLKKVFFALEDLGDSLRKRYDGCFFLWKMIALLMRLHPPELQGDNILIMIVPTSLPPRFWR